MFRTALVLRDGTIKGKNTRKRTEADEFILTAGDVRIAMIWDKDSDPNREGMEIIRF